MSLCYMYAPANSIDGTGHTWVRGIQLALTAPGNPGARVHWLRAMPYLMAGCLDAPDELPAGACYQISAETDEREITFMAEQMSFKRDGV